MKHYHDCPKKREARRVTLIDAFRGLSGGLSRLPKGWQHWTLSGPLGSDEATQVSQGSELGQIIEEGLIEPSQYHGVELEDDVYTLNHRLIKNTYGSKPKLFHGKIQSVLDDYLSRGKLKPALVNLDTMHQPEKGVEMLGSVLNTLNQTKGFTMVVLNVILSQKHRGVDFEDSDVIWREAEGNPYCNAQLVGGGWLRVPAQQTYYGSGRDSRTLMGTQVFFRRAS